MNTITRCPSCTTHYQVASSDLEAAKGWLRCGQCGHVFDSTGLVLRWASPALTVVKDPVLGSMLMDETDLVADPADRLVLDDLLKREDRAIVEHTDSELDSFEQALTSFKPSLPMPLHEPTEVAKTQLDASVWPIRYSVWLFALVLFLQIGFVQRHAIASIWPESASVIRHVCQSFGCQVNAIRNVEGLVIDSSELIQTEDGHVLRWTVRNATKHVLAMTALELTLMENGTQLVLRRVLLSTQTGAPESLAAGQSWAGELSLAANLDLKFSDYRLLSFYP